MIYNDNPEDFGANIEKSVCFTGHRPEKMPVRDPDFKQKLKRILYICICDAIEEGFDTFYCGMQRGIDVWAGQGVLLAKEKYPDIKLICVSPYENERWSRHGEDEADYLELLNNCDRFISLGDRYYSGCYQRRNEYMVDHSSMVLAAVADYQSGTGQTIRYAKSKGVRVKAIDLNVFYRKLQERGWI